MKIVLLLGTDGADVRSAKLCRSFSRMGHDVHFVGWDRRLAEKQPAIDSVHYHLMEHEVPLGRSTVWVQAKFALFAARQLKAIRPDAVYAVNEDNVLRAAPFHKRYYKHLICDFYDSHADRFSESPWPLRWPIRALSYFCKTFSDRLIVTDWLRFERLGSFQDKALIVQNVPEDPGSHLALQLPTGPTKILFTGAMGEARGLRQLLKAAKQCPELQIVAAGRPSDNFAKEIFLQHDQVDYRGVVTPKESLELAAACDAVFAFYAPVCQNQIFASPNKLFDAMCVGRPVILNSEVKMSQWAAEKSVGLLCPYSDIKALREIMLALPARRSGLKDFASEMRRCYVENHSWQKMEGVLGELCESFEQRTETVQKSAA